jgi:hypothetical protein
VTLAAEFLGALAERLDLPRSRVVIVPGNHDVLRTAEPLRRYASFDMLHRAFYGTLRAPFDPATPPHRRVERFDFAGDLGMEIIAFNSCEELNPEAQEQHGSIGVGQRDRAEELLDASQGKALFRVAAMHHHLESPVGIVREDYSVMDDAAATRHWLAQQRFHLALHGHQHVDWQDVREIDGWFLSIAAAGSIGVARYGRDSWQLPLGYQVIVIDGAAAGRRIRREYNPQTLEWTAAGRGDPVQRLRFGTEPPDRDEPSEDAPREARQSWPGAARVSSVPPLAAAVHEDSSGGRAVSEPPSPAMVRERYALRVQHLEREIQRHRTEMRVRIGYLAGAIVVAFLVAGYLWFDPVLVTVSRWIAPSAGLAIMFAGTFTFPRYFFSQQDTVDTLVFLRDGYARSESAHDPELLELLNDKFARLI